MAYNKPHGNAQFPMVTQLPYDINIELYHFHVEMVIGYTGTKHMVAIVTQCVQHAVQSHYIE